MGTCLWWNQLWFSSQLQMQLVTSTLVYTKREGDTLHSMTVPTRMHSVSSIMWLSGLTESRHNIFVTVDHSKWLVGEKSLIFIRVTGNSGFETSQFNKMSSKTATMDFLFSIQIFVVLKTQYFSNPRYSSRSKSNTEVLSSV